MNKFTMSYAVMLGVDLLIHVGFGHQGSPKVKDSTGVVEDPARVVEVSLTMSNLAFFGRLFFARWCCTFGRVACLSMLLLT